MKVICDTNIFISLFKGISKTITEVNNIGEDNLVMPSVTAMELFKGMPNKTDLINMQKKIKHYNIIHYNEQVSVLALSLIKDYSLSHNLQIPDAIIGAMAIEYKLPLFTYNLKDFSYMPHIQLYKV